MLEVSFTNSFCFQYFGCARNEAKYMDLGSLASLHKSLLQAASVSYIFDAHSMKQNTDSPAVGNYPHIFV